MDSGYVMAAGVVAIALCGDRSHAWSVPRLTWRLWL